MVTPRTEPFPGFIDAAGELDKKLSALNTQIDTLRPAEPPPGVPAFRAMEPPGQMPSSDLSLVDTIKVSVAALARLTTIPGIPRIPGVTTIPGIPGVTEIPGVRERGRETIAVVTPTPATQAEAQLLSQLRLLEQQRFSLLWQQHILAAIPVGAGLPTDNPGHIASIGDVLAKYANPSMTEEDRLFATRILNQSQLALAPQPVQITVADKERVIRQVTNDRSISTYGILTASSTNLMQVARSLSQPQLPIGMTQEEFASLTKEAQWSEEEIDAATKKGGDDAKLIQESWAEVNARHAVLMSAIPNLEIGKLTQMIQDKQISAVLSRPALALMLPLSIYQKQWSFVTAGFVSHAISAPDSTQSILDRVSNNLFTPVSVPMRFIFGQSEQEYEEFEKLFQEARTGGRSQWSAYSYSFENSHTNGFKKFTAEVAFDPITYFGFGVYAKLLKSLPPVGPLLPGLELGFVKGIDPIYMGFRQGLGKLAALETGWIELTDVAARGVQRGLTKIGGKTLNMMVGESTANSMRLIRAETSKYFNNRRFLSLSSTQVKSFLNTSARFAVSNPGDSTPFASVGQLLVRRVPITAVEISSLARRLGVQLEPEMLTGSAFAQLDTNIGHAVGLGGKIPKEEISLQILDFFQAPTTTAAKDTVVAFLTELEQRTFRNLDSMLKPERTVDILRNVFAHVKTGTEATLRADSTAIRGRMAALSAPLIFVDTLYKFSAIQVMDRISSTVARSYLMFAFYSPFNMLENALKMGLAKMNPFHRGEIVTELQDLTAGLIGLSDIFELSTGFNQGIIQELGAVTTARRIQPDRLTGMSQNTYRRLLNENREGWKAFVMGLPDKTFINYGGRIGLKQQANYIVQAYKRDLWDRFPEIMEAARTVTQNPEYLAELSRATNPDVAKGVAHRAFSVAITDTKLLDTMPDTFTLHTVDVNKLNEMVNQAYELGPTILDLFRQKITSREFLPNLDRFIAEAKNLKYQEIFSQPNLIRQQMEGWINFMVANPAKTLDELRAHIRHLQEMTELVTQSVDTNMVMMQQYGTTITNPTAKSTAFKSNWDDVITPLLDGAELQIRRLAAELTANTQLAGAAAGDFEQLITANIRHWELLATTRRQQRVLEDNLMSQRPLRGAPRAEELAFWQRFYSERTALWESARDQILTNQANLLELGVELQAGPTASVLFKPATGRPLAPMDIANLFGSIVQDVQQGLYIPEMGVFRSRKEWVSRVMARANRVAKKQNTTAQSLGFNPQQVGFVYDQFMQQLRGSELVGNLAKPAFTQLEALKIQIEFYAMQRNALFPAEGKEAIADYIQKVKADLLANPDTRILSRDLLTDEDGALLQVALTREEQARIEALIQKEIMSNSPDTRVEVEAAWRKFYGKPKAEYDSTLKGMSWDDERAWERRLANLADRTSLEPGLDEEIDNVVDSFINIAEGTGNDEDIMEATLRAQAIGTRISNDEIISFTQELIDLLLAKGHPSDIRVAVADVISTLERIDVQSELRTVIEVWFSDSSNSSLQALGRLASANREYISGTHQILRERYPSGYVRVHRGGGASARHANDPLDREFTNVTASREQAQAFQSKNAAWNVELQEDYKHQQSLRGTINPDIDSVVIRIEDVLSIGSAKESEFIIRSSVLRERMTAPLSVPRVWQQERQTSLTNAMNAKNLDFPVYDNMTAANTLAKSLYPFWSYEAHRPQWLARTFLQKPGVGLAVGRFSDYTDGGYIRIPGTSFQLNPLRSTIFMGGLRRLLQRDYPDYYDQFPGLSNVFDQASRFGFYGNIWVQGFFTAFGSKKTKSQVGELLPPLIQWPLEALVAASPNSLAAQKVGEALLSNRHRDRLIAVAVSKQGNEGDDLLNKVQSDVPLAPEEKQQWARGRREASLFNLWNIQTGLARMRPEELVEFIDASKNLLAEYTGVSVAMQDQMARAGVRVSDFGAFPPDLSDALNELEGASRWRGLNTGLQASEIGSAQALMTSYWNEVSDQRDQRQLDSEDLDRRLILPESDSEWINLSTWATKKRELSTSTLAFMQNLRNSSRYQYEVNSIVHKIPLTLDERKEWSAERGLDPIQLHPIDEWIALYFQKSPEIKDGEIDWSGYYLWRHVIEQALPNSMLAEALGRIRKWDTKLDTLKRQDYEYAGSYFGARDFVLSIRDEEQKSIIKQFSRTSDANIRAVLREKVTPDGISIISSFESELSDFRKAMRQLDPELDARLVLWKIGGVQSVQTEAAAESYNSLRKQYGFSN